MKILFCNRSFPQASARLESLLPEHDLIPCSEEEVPKYVGDVDVVVPLTANIDANIMERGAFGLIQQFGVGLNTVDIEAATQAGVRVARIPSAESGNAASVAEHTLLLMLALSRQLMHARQAFDAGRLGEPLGMALLDKTACIVGLGGVGTAVAVRLRACGMRLLGVHEHPERRVPSETGIERIFPLSELHTAIAGADYVVLCLNYDATRHNLIGQESFAAMKPGGFLINVARGGLIDHDALLEALQSGRLAGAGLDVFWSEPVDPSHPVFSQNVIATPHIAGVTDASYDGMARTFTENIARYARGEAPLYVVNTPRTLRGRTKNG